MTAAIHKACPSELAVLKIDIATQRLVYYHVTPKVPISKGLVRIYSDIC